MKKYLSLVKFSHTIFAMPFAMIGFFLATWYHGYTFDWTKLLLVVLCMIFARSAAMAFNRYADRRIDAKNPRTSRREIPAGVLSANAVLIFTIVCCALFMLTTWFINPLCFYLSPVALLVVLGYSLTKRFTSLSHFILGLGLSLAPLGSYLAVSEKFNILPVLFSCIVLLWVGGFDIIYALQDEEFDQGEKLFSMPAWLGKKNALILSTIVHVICASLVIYIGVREDFSYWYWIGATLFIGLLTYQHLIVKPNDLSKVNLAFATTNGIASVVFAVFVISGLYH